MLNRVTVSIVLSFAITFLFSGHAAARPARPAPMLPPPSGTIVNVSTEAQLQAAMSGIASNTTIVLAPGTYQLTRSLYFSGSLSNVGIRGASGDSGDVILVGPGMTNASYGSVPYGIWSGNGVNGITIANLTIRGFYFHPIVFNGGTQRPHVFNVHLIDAGQQFLKWNAIRENPLLITGPVIPTALVPSRRNSAIGATNPGSGTATRAIALPFSSM